MRALRSGCWFTALCVVVCLLAGLVASSGSSVTVLVPNGGEALVVGSDFTISWTTPGPIGGSIIISYSTDGGQSWHEIGEVAHTSGVQEYVWTVPDVVTEWGRVKVVWMRLVGPAADISDGSFVIMRPTAAPARPMDLTASAVSTTSIELNWIDLATDETGFFIERRTVDTGWAELVSVGANVTTYTDSGVMPGTTYQYRVRAYNPIGGHSPYSNAAEAFTPEEEPEPPEPVMLRLFIDQAAYYVNDEMKTMDTTPIIRHGRTLLPIRYIAESIGAVVSWDPFERKAMIVLGQTTVEMWLDHSQARVNGTMTAVDTGNTSVVPISIPPGRTMLPLRFVAEALGCSVAWDPVTRQVTITYHAMPPHPLGREIPPDPFD